LKEEVRAMLTSAEIHPTTDRYRHAAEAGDVDGIMATLSPDVVVYSPITERLTFSGSGEVRELLDNVFSLVSDVRYYADIGDEQMRAMFDRANVGGVPLDQTTRVRLNERGEIFEITLFFRPLPGLAALTAAIAPAVARSRHGALRATIASLLLRPLALMTGFGDRLVAWFA
jgi:hypothetical protein